MITIVLALSKLICKNKDLLNNFIDVWKSVYMNSLNKMPRYHHLSNVPPLCTIFVWRDFMYLYFLFLPLSSAYKLRHTDTRTHTKTHVTLLLLYLGCLLKIISKIMTDLLNLTNVMNEYWPSCVYQDWYVISKTESIRSLIQSD